MSDLKLKAFCNYCSEDVVDIDRVHHFDSEESCYKRGLVCQRCRVIIGLNRAYPAGSVDGNYCWDCANAVKGL